MTTTWESEISLGALKRGQAHMAKTLWSYLDTFLKDTRLYVTQHIGQRGEDPLLDSIFDEIGKIDAAAEELKKLDKAIEAKA